VQKQRIEENRRKALERQQAKKSGLPLQEKVPQAPAGNPENSPKASESKESLKRKGSDITPEKGALPESQKRALPATTAPAGQGEDKFRSFGKVAWMQYNDLYSVRLQKLQSTVLAQAQSLWAKEVPANNFLSSLTARSTASPGDVVAVGVTFKDLPSRSNVIEQYRDCMVATSCLPEDDVDAQPNLCSDADVVWLEDSTFRIQLELPADQVSRLATGFVVAIRGCVKENGCFEVKNMCFAQSLASTPLPALLPPKAENHYVAFLSGLFIGAPDEDTQARSRAIDFLLGKSETESEKLLGQAVQHIIVCGGVYHVNDLKEVPAGIADADTMFSQLAEKVPVDVLPGHKDPSNLSLPQMPLHPFFFRSAQKSSQFKSVSNPYQCSVDGLQVLGHSGQPVRDLMRCTSITKPLEALTTCLDGSLLAPTAPDTLITQSFDKADPFVIDTMPQVLFSGGHSQADYEWRGPSGSDSGTLCVCVPAFHKHPAVVLVNTRDPRDVRVQEFVTK
jgi:DNA polymerase delta subunit 2